MRTSLSLMPLLALLFPLPGLAQSSQPILEKDWTFDAGAPVSGSPAPFIRGGAAEGVLVTLGSGKIVVLSPRGQKRATMSIDVQPSCAAVFADLDGTGSPRILAADIYSSIYCFDLHGRRLWKYTRQSKASGFRHLVPADLDGDGKREIVFSDERGGTICLDGHGKLRLEVQSNPYRVSPAAIGDVNGDGRPEIVFGTEAHDVYCLRPDGQMVWGTRLDSSVGRCLPVIADVNLKGTKGVLVPTAFVGAHPGLHAFSGTTGVELWKAPCMLQSYQSTAIADLDGNGSDRILFGDKNTTVYCIDITGKRHWATQLDGRGIGFCPAVARITQSKESLIFQACNAGDDGKSLYILGASGKILESYAIPGGAGESPILCRFKGQKETNLLLTAGNGKVNCYRIAPALGPVKILWSGPGNSVGKAIAPTPQAAPSCGCGTMQESGPFARLTARMGTNAIPVAKVTPNGIICLRVREPGGTVRVRLMHQGPGEQIPDYSFSASDFGVYDVSVRWVAGTQHTIVTKSFLFTLPKDLSADAAELSQFEKAMRSFRYAVPAQAELADHLRATARANWDMAREAHSGALFDEARHERETALALALCCRRHHPGSAILVNQIHNPWPDFDAAQSLRLGAASADGVKVKMLGNAAESAAIAVTNLRPHAVTLRFVCGDFRSTTGATTAAKKLIQFREVLKVLPSMPLHPVEDPIPLLGEAQTLNFAPGETRKVWLTFRSRDLAAGDYHAAITIGDLASFEPPIQTPVTLSVYPIHVPDRVSYHHINWLYLSGIQDDELREAVTQDALDHHTTVFCIPQVTVHVDADGHPVSGDTAEHDRLVNRLKGKAFLLVTGTVGVAFPAGVQPNADLQDRAFAESLRWYGEHMTSIGVDYSEYALYPADEPGLHGPDKGFVAYCALVKRLKAADPRILVYADVAGGASAQVIQPIKDLIDVWCPDLHLLRGQPQELGEIFKKGKQYWHYEAPGDQRNLNPMGYNRMKAWVAFGLGMNGGGWWVYNGGQDWWFFDPHHDEYGTVYATDRGSVSTKRWEAARQGIEDYELLRMLREAAQRDGSAKGEQALKLLDEALAYVTKGQEHVSDISRQIWPYTPDFDKWMGYRDQLIQALVGLPH